MYSLLVCWVVIVSPPVPAATSQQPYLGGSILRCCKCRAAMYSLLVCWVVIVTPPVPAATSQQPYLGGSILRCCNVLTVCGGVSVSPPVPAAIKVHSARHSLGVHHYDVVFLTNLIVTSFGDKFSPQRLTDHTYNMTKIQLLTILHNLFTLKDQ